MLEVGNVSIMTKSRHQITLIDFEIRCDMSEYRN